MNRIEVNCASGEVTEYELTLEEIAEIAANQPDPAEEVNSKLNAVRAVRESMLNRMAGIALVAQIDGDTVTVNAFKTARTALLDITKNPPTDPGLVDAFIMLQYLAIRDALPASLVTAFAGLDT